MVRTLPLTVIILTKDEEAHLSRCLENVVPWAEKVCVVDSGSTDRTQEIARRYGAEVHEHVFRNQADQNGFELPEIPENCLGILRESIREDERLKSFNQYHLPSVDKIAIDLREDQYDLWMAFQQIFTKTTHYQSFMKGILSVVFLFKTYQENDHFERLLEA